MAFIGMRYPVVSTIATEPANAAPTYNAGKVIGHAITGNLTITRNNNPLYGDDVVVEDDNGITAMSLEMGVDDLTEEVQAYMLGLKTNAGGSGGTTTYEDTSDPSPYVGVGYIRVRRLNGETKFQANWIHKAIFSQESENSQTKGETIEWQTPTITGRVMGVYNDNSGVASFREKAIFDTEGAARTWLNTKAGI